MVAQIDKSTQQTGTDLFAVSPDQLFFIGCAAVGLIVAVITRAPLTYDAPCNLLYVLATGAPVVMHARFIDALLQSPALWASHFTKDFATVSFFFSLAYASMPLLAIISAWYMTKQRAGESLFAIFAWFTGFIGIISLICFQSEGLIGLELAWPVFLAVLYGVPRGVTIPCIALTSLVAVCHPNSFLIFLTLALVSGWKAKSQPTQRRRFVILATIFSLLSLSEVALEMLLWPSEAGMAGVGNLKRQISWALKGAPFLSYCLSTLSIVLLAGNDNRKQSGTRSKICFSLFLAAVLVLVPWASNVTAWTDCHEARGPLIYLELGLFLLCTLLDESRRLTLAPFSRQLILRFSGLCFVIVLSLQCLGWNHILGTLRANIDANPNVLIPYSQLNLPRSCIHSYAAPSLCLLIQGYRPEKLVLFDRDLPPKSIETIAISEWWQAMPLKKLGWLDLSELKSNLAKHGAGDPACAVQNKTDAN